MKQTYLIFYFVLYSLFICSFTVVKADTYPEVLFANSNLPYSYANSKVTYAGSSWIMNVRKNLPVSDSVFFTPKNSLVLKYVSAEGGEWNADIFYQDNYLPENNSVLIFKLYVHSPTEVTELPAIQLIHADSSKTDQVQLANYIDSYQENMWVSVEIPLNQIGQFQTDKGIAAISFVQSGSDGKNHLLYIDQIEVLPRRTPQNRLTGAAVLQHVKAFERHVDITWRLPLTPSLRYIKIYRSEDNKDFQPVAIRPVFSSRYSDVVPETGKEYYYKIAWVDYQYRESPFSEVEKVQTKTMTDAELLDMVHHANIKYFADGAEFNSGMQLLRPGTKSAIVSPALTGVAIMASISGVEQKIFTREQLTARVIKIVRYLRGAEARYGAFPALMDGRTGEGVYSAEEGFVVDLNSTSLLIQGLLTAKQYLNADNQVEAELREKINEIWNAVQWNKFTTERDSYLYTNWSEKTEFSNALPLLGRDALTTYLLALASPNNNIELDSYNDAMNRFYNVDTALVDDIEELSLPSADTTSAKAPDLTVLRPMVQLVDTTESLSSADNVHYGLPLAVMGVEESLSRILSSFLVFDPRGKRDKYANYYHELQNHVLIQYRKSLEENQLPISLGEGLMVNAKGWVSPSSTVATYPVNAEFAMKNLIDVYREYPELFWDEYGFRTINLVRNQESMKWQGVRYGISAIMIENGKSNLLWNLFSKDEDVDRIVRALFTADPEKDNSQ